MGPVQLFRVPISILLKSILGQDVQLKGLLESKDGETKVGIMDDPVFLKIVGEPTKQN